jgi:8-oxo-dGTP diphosphatase
MPVLRLAARAVVIAPDARILLVRFVNPAGETWWATPGGALVEGELREDALGRELREEAGIAAPIGPCIWVREHVFQWGDRRVRQLERYFVVKVQSTDVAPELPSAALAAEGVHEHRWWTLAELELASEIFAPQRLPELLRELLETGLPAEPIDAGI